MTSPSRLPERAATAGRHLAAVGGRARPGDLGAALGLDHNAQATAIRQLRDAGLAAGDRRTVELTPAGWALFAGSEPVGAGDVVDDALAGWPYRHRAFVELAVSAVVARHHLGEARPEPHLGFMVIGTPGTGKSPMAELVCALFGWNWRAHTVFVEGQTRRSLLGRLERGEAGYELAAGDLVELPFAFFDEYDKGDEEARRALLPFLQGTLTVKAERGQLTVRPTPMVALNPEPRGDRYAKLRPEYRKRCVVLDLGDDRRVYGDLEGMLTAFYRDGGVTSPLRLDELVPPATALPDDALAVVRKLPDALTDAGYSDFPGVRALELATLGRAALMGAGADLRLAAYQTCWDYLVVSETVDGLVDPEWAVDLEAIRGTLGPGVNLRALERAVEHRRRQQHDARTVARAAKLAREAEDHDVVERRGQLVEQLRLAIEHDLDLRRVPRDLRPQAKGVRDRLGRIREQAQALHCSTANAGRLAELEQLAAGPLERSADVRSAVTKRAEEDRAAAEENRRRRQRDADDRAAIAQQRKREQTEAQRALDDVVALAKHLEALYRRRKSKPDESPLHVLAELDVFGQRILAYQPPPPQPAPERPRGLWGNVKAAMGTGPIIPYGRWYATADPSVDFPGTRLACPALDEWGPATRAVLTTALDVVYRVEDQLRARLIRSPRRGRVPLGAPAPVAQLAPGR